MRLNRLKGSLSVSVGFIGTPSQRFQDPQSNAASANWLGSARRRVLSHQRCDEPWCGALRYRQHRWTMAAPYEAEIAFLSGVGADSLVARVSFAIVARFRRRSRFHPAGLHIAQFRRLQVGQFATRAPAATITYCSIRRPTGRPASSSLQGRDGSVDGGRRTSRSRRPPARPIRPISRSCADRTARARWKNKEPYNYPPSAARRSALCRAATTRTSSRSTPLVTRETSPP